MIEQSFSTPEPVRLDISVHAAEIEITAIDGGESSVTLGGSQKLIDATRIELEGDRLVVALQKKLLSGLFERFDGSLHLHARVPHGSRVEITTASGEARLDGTFARLEAKSASGNIRAAGQIDGDVKVGNVSGDVRLSRVLGDLNVQTVSGNVDADSVEGSVTVKSVSGSVRVGSVREGTVTVQSVSGDVQLGVASGTNVDLDARSASGQLSSEVALADAPDGEPGPMLVVRGMSVSGDFRLVRAA